MVLQNMEEYFKQVQELLHEEDNDASDTEEYAIYLCAGYGALCAAGYPEEDTSRACEDAFERVEKMAIKPLETVKQLALDLMKQPENISAVQRVATQLVDKGGLDGFEQELLVDISDGIATLEVLEQYRTAKERIKDTLL